MSQATKDVRAAVLGALKACGWAKTRSTAALEGADAIAMVSVQTSSYDDMMFINVGIRLRALEATASHDHLRYRIENLINGFPAPIESAAIVDLAQLVVDVKRAEPALRSLTRLDELRRRMAEGRLENGQMIGQARALLQAESP